MIDGRVDVKGRSNCGLYAESTVNVKTPRALKEVLEPATA